MRKSEGLQALRGIAFLGIFFIHSEFYVNWAGISVSVFFVLSGFLTERKHGGSTDAVNLKQCVLFACRRIRRIYPLHIMLMLFMAFIAVAADHSIRSIAVTAVKILLITYCLQPYGCCSSL